MDGNLCSAKEISAFNRGSINTLKKGFLQCAVFVRCGYVRSLPTYIPKNDKNGFDMLQCGVCLPCEPAGIIKRSGDWRFVKTLTHIGWTHKNNLAPVSRRLINALCRRRAFATVICKNVSIGETVYPMSARLPYFDGKIYYPVKKDGVAVWHAKPLPPGICRGALPYTRSNLLSQAAAMLGEPYFWGCKNGGIDCSAFTKRVYGCCGLIVPEYSEIQSRLSRQVGAYPLSEFDSAKCGDILYIPGHVMLKFDKKHVIHASFSQKKVCIALKDDIGR